MRQYFLLGSMVIIMLMISGGCSISDEYRCESNDLCSSTTEWKYYSCSNDTGHCDKVDPLAIDPSTLPDATAGQSDYTVTLNANGGISPYTWSLAREDEKKLKWLTITKEGDNKAILHNDTDSNSAKLFPAEPVDGITVTITVLDSSKHGTATREDNQGKPFTMTINIKDCNKTNCDNGDGTTTLVGTSRCSDGRVKTCNQNSLGCAAWGGEDSCSTNSCQTAGTNKNISCCNDQNHCANSNDTRCNKDSNWMEKCGHDATGCLSWQQDTQCSGKGCKSDGSNCIDCVDTCTTSGDRQCSFDNTAVNTCLKNTEECLVWTIYEQCNNGKICIGGKCSCSGCWDGANCQPGNDINKCGIGDGTCVICPENIDNKCSLTGCTNGQCVYRYTIQTNNVDGVNVDEVYDANNNLYWKRHIETRTYTWYDAIKQCSKSYRLPSIGRINANPNKAELETIIEKGPEHGSLGSPYINTCAFFMPTCDSDPYCWFWSSSTEVGAVNSAWGVEFAHVGRVGTGNNSTLGYVRCVRVGP